MRVCALLPVLLLASCGGPEQRQERTVPGEEPLETDSLADEEVVTLEEKPVARPARSRPCSWARAWSDPAEPDPVLAGIGGVAIPEKVSDAPISLPLKEPAPAGAMVVELVIGPDGSVKEASVIQSTEPTWPEAEERILQAVRSWRYEAPSLGGTPVSVCSTLSVRPSSP